MTSYPHVPSRSPFRIRDSQQNKAPISIASNERWSLGLELDDMWHMKPIQQHSQPLIQDDLFTQLLISQALLDSNDFEILSFEQVESLKKEHQDLQDLISTLSRSIQVETRIKNVSKSLGNMHNSRDSVLYLEQQNQSNATRLNELMQRYEYMNIKAFDIQESLLKHTAAVLNRGTHVSTGQNKEGRAEALNKLREIVSRFESSTQSKDPLALLQSVDRQLASNSTQWLSRLSKTEILLDSLYTQASSYTQRKKAFQLELSQYKNEYSELSQLTTRPSPQGDSIYKRQLEEHIKTYDANLNEQRRLIEDGIRRRQELIKGQQELQNKVTKLDYQIKEKSRLIDQRDVRMTRLKEELKTPKPNLAYERQEEKWTAHRTAVEEKFDTLMTNYDEIITTAMDFDSNRMRYDKTVDSLSSNIQQLEAQLIEEKLSKIGYGASNTTELRKEFRMLISDIKSSHEQRIHREMQENHKLKRQLEQLENEQKNKSSIGHSIQVQTE